jgi:hypothetical protein
LRMWWQAGVVFCIGMFVVQWITNTRTSITRIARD